MKIRLRDTRISTDVYCKETDTHQYLEYKSCHPKHVKMGIPYGQALIDLDIFVNRMRSWKKG